MSGPLVAEVGGISGWIWSWKNWKSCGDGQERGDKEGERGETLPETFSVVNVLT